MGKTQSRSPVANRSGMNGPKSGPCADPITCECIGVVRDDEGNVVAILTENPAGGPPIETPLGQTGDEVKDLILACLADLTDANTTTQIIEGPLPDSLTPPAEPADDLQDIHKQFYKDGIRCWKWDGSAWAHTGDQPYPASCCPGTDPSGQNNPPTPGTPPPTLPNGAMLNPWLVVDLATSTVTDVYYWDDGIWWHLPVCCPKLLTGTSTTNNLADAQAAADALVTPTTPAGTLIKITEADGCVSTFIVAADGMACLVERPHRHIYARVNKNIKWNIDSATPAGSGGIAAPCVTVTLECAQDLRIAGGYSFRNATNFDGGTGTGGWDELTEVNVYAQPMLDGALVPNAGGTIVSAMQGLGRGEEEQVPFNFVLANVPAGTHEICMDFGLTLNELDGATNELGQINQVEFTAGSVHA